MTRKPAHPADTARRQRITALLRAALRRRVARRGAWRANPFRRLAAAVLCAPATVRRLPADHRQPDPLTMPTGSFRLSVLGLGLAGGGGGSPGRIGV